MNSLDLALVGAAEFLVEFWPYAVFFIGFAVLGVLIPGGSLLGGSPAAESSDGSRGASAPGSPGRRGGGRSALRRAVGASPIGKHNSSIESVNAAHRDSANEGSRRVQLGSVPGSALRRADERIASR